MSAIALTITLYYVFTNIAFQERTVILSMVAIILAILTVIIGAFQQWKTYKIENQHEISTAQRYVTIAKANPFISQQVEESRLQEISDELDSQAQKVEDELMVEINACKI